MGDGTEGHHRYCPFASGGHGCDCGWQEDPRHLAQEALTEARRHAFQEMAAEVANLSAVAREPETVAVLNVLIGWVHRQAERG